MLARKFLLIGIVWAGATPVEAAVISAANCTQSVVQAVINSAQNGDTVLLPGGTCTWASAVTIPNTKGITLDGNGATITGSIDLQQNGSATSRVTRFNFTAVDVINAGGSKTSAPFRIDHSTFTTTTSGSVFLYTYGNAPGLIDHNNFYCPQNCEMIHNMAMGPSDASGWTDDIVPGGPSAVYIEDNKFVNNGVSGNPAYFWGSSAVQAYYGARTVFRHNYLILSHVDQHGTGGMIGSRWWEIYDNTFDTNIPNASQCCFITLRAGSGVVFNNHHTGANLNGDSIDLYEEDTGYPALYQVGRGKNQVLDPAYVWGNDAFFSVGSQTPAMVQVNRDYFLAPKPSYTPYTYPHPLQGGSVPPSPTGNVRYVDNSGSPACANTSSSGSEAQPFCTFQYGISQINGGDTLYVKNGTYNESFTITGPSGSAAAHTVLSAYPGHTPILRGSGFSTGGRMKISHGCSYIDFIGFELTNYNQGLYLDDDGGTSTACTHLLIDRVHVHDVGQEGIAIRAGSPTGPRDFIIRNSEIDHTGRLGPSQNGEGIYLGNSSGVDNTNGVTILGNKVHDTQDECIELKGDSHDNIIDGNDIYNCLSPGSSFGNTGGAIELDEPRNSTADPHQIIRNNVIHDIVSTSGITKRGIRAGTGATISNNVLYNITSGYSCIHSNSSNYPRQIYHNTLDCTTGNAVVNSGTTIDSRNNIGPSGTNNLAANAAYFVNAAAHDYHLVAGAAPVNAGADLRATVPNDKDGGLRDASPDLGAYEYTAGAPSSRCDVNSDGSTNVSDVQLCANQAIGAVVCGTADINQDGSCNVVDVQRVVNNALGGQCVTQ